MLERRSGFEDGDVCVSRCGSVGPSSGSAWEAQAARELGPGQITPGVIYDAFDRILTCVASKITMVSEAPKAYVLSSND